ncbi:MAG: TetR/AcrR family transcriptional regulator [Candidatus Hydrogenedentes bacterium]|nr:TetR/AcrR family transcriptional regulator [Candidatus Hydrogenedentota bacterium]
MEDKTGRLSRKERERQAHRMEILDAAESVFIRNGYYNATVEQIAQESEFAVGTLYNFFESKSDMYAHVIERLAEEFMSELESQTTSTDDPKEALTRLICLRIKYYEAHRGFFRVIVESSPGSHMDPVTSMPDSCKGLYKRYIGTITNIIARGIERGMFRDADPLYQALCIEGIINATILYWLRDDDMEPIEVRLRKVTKTVMSWILAN